MFNLLKGSITISCVSSINYISGGLKVFKAIGDHNIPFKTHYNICTMLQNINRLRVFEPKNMEACLGYLTDILRWKSRPTTIMFLVLYVLIVLNFAFWWIPCSIAILLLHGYYDHTYNAPHEQSFDDEIHADQERETILEKIIEKIQLKTSFQTKLEASCDFLERINHLYCWSRPALTITIVICLMLSKFTSNFRQNLIPIFFRHDYVNAYSTPVYNTNFRSC